MSPCEHLQTRTDVKMLALCDEEGGDTTRFAAELTVTCEGCGGRFGFRGVPAGLAPGYPTCSPDALTLRLPLMSPSEVALAGPLPGLQRGHVVEVDGRGGDGDES